MLLGCHSDAPAQEEGWVSVNPHFETPRVAGCQLVVREGQDCLSLALKRTWVHFTLSKVNCIFEVLYQYYLLRYSRVGLEGNLPFPLNSFCRNIGIMISI